VKPIEYFRKGDDWMESKYVENLYKILDTSIKAKASDIHLTNKLVPTLRIDGELRKLGGFEVHTPEILATYVEEILNEEQMENYEKDKEADLSISYGDVRFRVHIYRQSESDAIALRTIPTKIPSFEQMNLPLVLKKFTKIQNGLVLITGITGSGKSTTLAAMIDEINRTQSKNIITVEDPIEFIHEHKKSIVNQREIGVDVLSFSRAVRAAMREDPDILLVGELRDLETIQNAITMAETGHLVLGTLHTKSVPETIDRIIDVFPPTQQDQVRIQLANCIEGIVCQDLLPKIGGGRVPLCEIMITNDAIRSIIRENQNPNAIVDQMQTTSKKTGAQTKIQSLAKLVADRKITRETALKNIKSEDFDLLNKTIVSLSR
jgi:twitching motility protein PilT